MRYNERMLSIRALLLMLCVASGTTAQVPADRVPADSKLAAAKTTLEAWLASNHADPALLQQAVAAILAAGPEAIADVGARARKAGTDESGHASRGLDAVITHVTVGFLKRETESEMTFAGQYDALRALQPFVGQLLLRLMLDTPDWFSQHERHLLVFPLRDVFPESPGADVCKQLHVVATDEDYEPEPLRQNLAFALAQWGDRTLIDARIARVTKESTADDISEDRRAALRYELADIHYTLREYERAAQIHVEMLRHGEVAGADLAPIHYYNAACCLARAGAAQAALDELQRAARLMKSGRVDPSRMLDRKLFERDPDLASVRADERFAAIVETAFGEPSKAPEKGGDGDRRRDG